MPPPPSSTSPHYSHSPLSYCYCTGLRVNPTVDASGLPGEDGGPDGKHIRSEALPVVIMDEHALLHSVAI